MTDILSINDCYRLWKETEQNRINSSTYHRYRNLMEKHLLTYFADVKLCDITHKDINVFFEKKKEDGMSEVAMHMLLMLLKKLLQLGGTDIVRLGLEHTVHIKHNRRSVEIMQREEWEKLDAVLRKHSELNYVAVCLAFKMGLTVGEICGLTWNEVDLEQKTLLVKDTVQRVQNITGGGKKTMLAVQPIADTAKRELPVPKTVLKILLKYKKSKGYVLECKEGKIPDPRREQARLEKLFEGHKMRGYSFYILRDTFAVRCLQAGMTIEDLSYVLGHATVTVTAQRYKGFLEMAKDRTVVLKQYMDRI